MPDHDHELRTEVEVRVFPAEELTVERRQFPGEEDRDILVGYAATFEQLSEDLWGMREKVARGAFSKSIGGDVRALFNHDPNHVLGRTTARTLLLAEDQRGLKAEIDPPDTALARGVIEAVRRRDVTGMSFAFRTIADKWEQDPELGVVRTLLEVKLRDVSVCTYPAYPQTDVALRMLEQFRERQRPQRPSNLIRARTQLAAASLFGIVGR